MPQPSATRWSPTPEQLMILEEIYRTAIRTPNSYQIQQITALLSCYGRIESKNVFYWFQNHKAREKQKMRKRLCKNQHLRQQQQQQKHQINSDSYPHMFQLEFNQSPSVQYLQQLPFLSTFKQNLPPQGIYPEMEMKPMPMGSSTGRGNEYCMMMTGMTSPTATAHPCCRPLKTLELFPIKSTGIKEEPEIFPCPSHEF